MPIHSFEDPETHETIDVYVAASAPIEEHHTQTRDGKVYKRVYSAPLAATNMGTRLGDATKDDFARATDGKRGFRVGDAWEISAEMAAKRRDRDGVDLVREEGYKRYEQENGGEKHPDVIRREKVEVANAKLATMGIKINL